jgi:REP element-mobilizing transposase RayT
MTEKTIQNTYHVVGKSELKKWPCGQRSAWKIFCKVINALQKENDIKTRAFVLMNNHYHWLVEYELKDDPAIFEWFHELIRLHFLDEFHQYIEGTLEWEPQALQIDTRTAYINTYKYIYRNPVTAGLEFKAELYPYSTLKYVLGTARQPFAIDDNMNVIQDAFRVTKWINAPWEEQLYFKYH